MQACGSDVGVMRWVFALLFLVGSASALQCYTGSGSTNVTNPDLNYCYVACQLCSGSPTCSDTLVYGIFNGTRTLSPDIYGARKCSTNLCNAPNPLNRCSSNTSFAISCDGCVEAFEDTIAAAAGIALAVLLSAILSPVICVCGCVGIAIYICVSRNNNNRRVQPRRAQRSSRVKTQQTQNVPEQQRRQLEEGESSHDDDEIEEQKQTGPMRGAGGEVKWKRLRF